METEIIARNEYGFREKDMWFLRQIFALNPEIEKVILYGSRATGKFKSGSDVDLALVGKDVNHSTVAHIHYVLEETGPMPLFFDVLHYESLDHPVIKKKIDEHGVVIYLKSDLNI